MLKEKAQTKQPQEEEPQEEEPQYQQAQIQQAQEEHPQYHQLHVETKDLHQFLPSSKGYWTSTKVGSLVEKNNSQL